MQLENNDFLLRELYKKEKAHGLYDCKIKDVSVFRLIRFPLRVKYMNKVTGYTNKTVSSRKSILEIARTFFISLYSLLVLLFTQRNKVIFFSFPRLNQMKGKYMDKFIDPIIDKFPNTNFLVFQKNLGGKILRPRYNVQLVSYIDFLTISSFSLALITFPFFYLKYKNRMKELRQGIQSTYQLSSSIIMISIQINAFFIEKMMYRFVFWCIKVKSIVVVNRMIFSAAILAAKEANIPTFELQHGITLSETTLYTGEYDKELDVDYFLGFGEVWKNNFFGVPKTKIINIGWAYKDFVTKYYDENQILSNRVLLISHPAITDKLISFILNCKAVLKEDITFELRLHPQEQLNSTQLEVLSKAGNVVVSDKKEDSFLALLRHQYIMGDNSTVMYEALSLGKKVAKLNLGEFKNEGDDRFNHFGFYNIESIYAIPAYIQYVKSTETYTMGTNNLGVYDEFNKEKFEDIVLLNKI